MQHSPPTSTDLFDTDSSLEEDIRHRSYVNNRVIYLYVTGALMCMLVLISTVIEQNWSGAVTILIVTITLIGASILARRGQTERSFQLVTLVTFFVISGRMIIHLGINNIALYILYPIFVGIGILFRHQPRMISIFAFSTFIWLGSIYLLERNGFYLAQPDSLNFGWEIVIIGFSFFFIMIILQIMASNILATNRHLIEAREEALIAKTKAESANEAKSKFLANMSHELRTPLNAIIGYSEMIAEESEGNIRNDSERIQTSATNLLRIINDILEISKIESGKHSLSLNEVYVNSVVEAVQTMIQPQFFARQNRLEVEVTVENDHFVTDYQKLTQILINLLTNANKFTAGGLVQLSVRDDGQQIEFSVKDNGMGMPEEALARIFVPFEQVDSDLNRQFDGAGLGLSICKQFAQVMHGDLTVESELDKGSCFTLTLPLAYE